MVFAMISSTDKTMASVDGEKINEDELYDALVEGQERYIKPINYK